MESLERNKYYPCAYKEYIIKDGKRIGKVVREIFFILNKQIRLARRFVSGFIYETDATFNTNKLRLLLTTMVGIDNTGSTFPIAFLFITSESAKAFNFASKCLSNLVFYNCLEPTVILGDFAKGLAASIIAKAEIDL